MRVALDVSPLVTPSNLRGIGRYVRGLISGLAELERAQHLDCEVCGIGANKTLHRVLWFSELSEYAARPVSPPVWSAGDRRNFLVTLAFSDAARERQSDILHLTDPKGLPSTSGIRLTLTCHDLIPILLSRQYLPHLPDWDRVYAGIAHFRYSRAHSILAVSHATKRDLIDQLEIPPEKITVVWHGVDHQRFHATAAEHERAQLSQLLDTDGDYLLYLGAGDSRKDLDTLIYAYAQSAASKQAKLVLGGALGRERTRSLQELANRLGVIKSCIFPGYIDESLIPALYRHASVHVFPSRYEGFGLPVLEALACGAPTITSPGSSLDEVAGDAALIIPCGKIDALSVALDQVTTDRVLNQQLRTRGLARVQEFTWRRCAERTIDFWRRTRL